MVGFLPKRRQPGRNRKERRGVTGPAKGEYSTNWKSSNTREKNSELSREGMGGGGERRQLLSPRQNPKNGHRKGLRKAYWGKPQQGDTSES